MKTNFFNQHGDYAYPTLPELKRQSAKVLCDFHPRKGDPLCVFSKEKYFEIMFNINVKKIYKWKNCSDQEDRRPDLKDVLFLAILVNSTRQEARYYMAVAGYPYVEYPVNHKKYDHILAVCFAVIDAVYAKYELTSDQKQCFFSNLDENLLRKKRLDEAYEQIFIIDEELANELIPSE